MRTDKRPAHDAPASGVVARREAGMLRDLLGEPTPEPTYDTRLIDAKSGAAGASLSIAASVAAATMVGLLVR